GNAEIPLHQRKFCMSYGPVFPRNPPKTSLEPPGTSPVVSRSPLQVPYCVREGPRVSSLLPVSSPRISPQCTLVWRGCLFGVANVCRGVPFGPHGGCLTPLAGPAVPASAAVGPCGDPPLPPTEGFGRRGGLADFGISCPFVFPPAGTDRGSPPLVVIDREA